jgi:phosphate transport system substrate-binding protein
VLRTFVASLACAVVLCVPPAAAQEVAGTAAVTGAGSTFAYPIVSRWSKGYQRFVAGGAYFPAANSGLDDPPTSQALDYEPIGSLAGMMRIRMSAVDFGASDAPLSSADLQKLGLIQFPIVMGGVVIAVHIDGVGPGDMKLSGPVLADIFLGKVRTWNHEAIRALNPSLRLPDAPINVLHRSDGSGTTYNFTHYLSRISPQWRDSIGFDLTVKWPLGTGAKGNLGISQAVKATRNSIGYVEYAQARQAKLVPALLQNQAGVFVSPDANAFQAAAASAEWDKVGDFNLMLTDAPGANAYPIVLTVFALMQKDGSARRTQVSLNFFRWSLEQGTREAADLGYVPLPPEVVSRVKEYWAKNLRAGS